MSQRRLRCQKQGTAWLRAVRLWECELTSLTGARCPFAMPLSGASAGVAALRRVGVRALTFSLNGVRASLVTHPAGDGTGPTAAWRGTRGDARDALAMDFRDPFCKGRAGTQGGFSRSRASIRSAYELFFTCIVASRATGLSSRESYNGSFSRETRQARTFPGMGDGANGKSLPGLVTPARGDVFIPEHRLTSRMSRSPMLARCRDVMPAGMLDALRI